MTALTIGGRRMKRVLLHIVLALSCLVMIYPVLWMVFSSFKPTAEIFSSEALLPKQWLFANYKTGWFGVPKMNFGTFLANSSLISLLVVIGNIVSASLVAFAFARLRFKLKSLWFGVMLMTMMLPGQVTLIPQYALFHKLDWINTYLPLTVPHFLGGTPFFIFLLVQFIRGIPRELDEAATIDGCGTFQIYWRIVMPLCGPALITTAIFSFIWTWDDFFGQLIYINDVKKYTAPLGLRLFLDGSGKNEWGPMLAMSVLSLLPSFVIFMTCQKYFVQGIATSGLKG
ncbi:carbohydrate ABC transporter permease [Paenibacillus contaminans]|uniref:Carbohydrate ABC transporter permease n=1 Tax=Paenibacillus contaminans TaxID=450362 RepID=A0A329LX00_9BACL|nr:carbohydrate ABC transporter permease [Paenibacillus contaminans]RAV12495.1 carbohydrate ABC transporter permease [Paenibacillus contaminans]